MSYKVFTDGALLTATDINNNLMRQSLISVANQAARDAIASPQAGMQVYRVDTDRIEKYNGSSWGKPDGAVVTSTTSSTSSFYAANTGLLDAPAITGDGVSMFKITAVWGSLTGTVANDGFDIGIMDNTTSTVLQLLRVWIDTRGNAGGCVVVTNVPSAGSHVYRLAGSRATGSGTAVMNAGTTRPIKIIVEQIT